jgi:hypothetical protein
MAEVVAVLEPNEVRRKALYDEMRSEDMGALGDELNDQLGGVSEKLAHDTESMSVFRRNETLELEKSGMTESSGQLLTGSLDAVLEAHPELVEGLRHSSDVVAMLKQLREIYAADYEAFASELEQARAEVGQRAERLLKERMAHMPAPANEKVRPMVEAVRGGVDRELGADVLAHLHAPKPTETTEVYRPSQRSEQAAA